MTTRILRPAGRAPFLLAVSLLIGITAGCGEDKQPEPPPAHTLGDFCNPLLELFRNDLDIKDAKLVGVEEDEPIDDSTTTEICSISSRTSPIHGGAWITRLKDGAKIADDPQWFESNKYTPLPGHAVDVWIRDSRAITRSIQTKGTVDLITQIGAWRGHLEFEGAVGGPLVMTDEQVGKAADALINATDSVSD
ncbi:hypothetical protein JK358_09165 [Nocardia sp. 2]|uniref:DUF3558 domain-containing protein n=1 Tax=Nocardia acididurans TaxID=2802282 RepID=A0ABS1M236_9NOCA|nr:hypothetical protein [Nocardia acididurans]MBL1074566.1 hypothetical protein [Nocardia acididurans]